MSPISDKVEPTVCICIYDNLAQEYLERRCGLSPLEKDDSGGRSYMIPHKVMEITFHNFEEGICLFSEDQDS
jgi:hypothetical protein